MWGAMKGTRARDRFVLRRDAEQRGRRSEFWAALVLSCKFYRVLGWRVKTRLGELDLIAMSPDGVLCFIEVKAREAEGSAAEAITARQRSRIERAAALYLGAHPALRQKAIRFDAILVTPRSWPRHVKDAWRPES
jgi:putative endonuclease